MLQFSLSLLFGFIVNNLIGTLAAKFIGKPLVHDAMSKFERKKEDLKMAPLLVGYFLITLMMVLAYPYFALEASWLVKGTVLGVFSGVMSFVSVHLVISGWSILPPKEMLISGLIDTISIVATGISIAYIYSI
ncbi:MAG: hypothetical protein HRT58_21445 [Crocinitomicaceae bacterium]|nr:hypothetical protein [Flavobacteriales bacterium]NQZ38239.1 hypothetical protein [Crocinitomicaceae bacterium]